ncbi:class I SAM-dependent methyltransferase [Gloeocapsa sp. PCC 73106]|uniref:class I SAM-dependent methyltransferase n=1 Tax=Gloeocapsa sp. PCC 73106 TaxID=102232 RepID=UPI0002AD110E|nr:methyltransferase domain-containing protein [Gloeocapsa sp. PCC 73106]ELR98212.1 methylase involved in ubiquinone/menaquinone biosynthesis [Gloeocapsa sp. PCC 73106]
MTLPVQQEYSHLAPIYDRRWASYIQKSIQATTNLLEINPPNSILDLGCGTGTLLQSLSHLFPEAQLVGLDFSQEMINIAKKKLPDSVKLLVGSADHLPFADNCFDLVISTSAFHYFPNPRLAIQEANRVLKPKGSLVISDWCSDYWTCRLLDFWLRLFNRAHFHTYGVKELQQLFESQGLTEIKIDRYKINWFWGMMTAQGDKRIS